MKPIATSNKYILMSHSTDNDNDNDINCDARDDSGENNNDDVKKVNISFSLSANWQVLLWDSLNCKVLLSWSSKYSSSLFLTVNINQ